MVPLSDRDLRDLQQALPWFTGTRLPDGRLLGNPSYILEPDNYSIQKTLAHLDRTPDSTVLEVGCAEGEQTVYLATLFKRVRAVEVRPRSIIALLTRLFVYDLHNVDVWLRDVSLLTPDWGRFDALFHVGVLYHLTDPVAHLLSLKGVADQILLDTHYGNDALAFQRREMDHGGKRYTGYLYKELGWDDPFSGVDTYSVWLPKEVIMEVLREIGYNHVELLNDYHIGGSPRLTLVAKKT